MAENQTDTAVEELPNSIRIEDAGPGTKKVYVEIPAEKVKAKIAEQYRELRQEAAIPGFRKGRAPQKLLEKKFDADIKDQVRRSLISDSYQEALEQNSLQVLGEPEFENLEEVKLPEDGPLTYSFSVEIQPEVVLPELQGIKVKKPRIEVTEEHVEQAMTNLREQQGTLVPVEDRGVEEKDQIVADVRVKLEGEERSHQHDAPLMVRPGRIAGLQIDDVPERLAGARPGETRSLNVTVPDDYPMESARGKQVEIEIAVNEIKRLEPAEINQEFLESLGFNDEQELRDALREQLKERIDHDVQQVMRQQVVNHLMEKVNIELPAKLSDRQAERVVNRRAAAMMMRGASPEQVDANLQKLRQGAEEEGARELKTFFILQKVAEDLGADVTEAELNYQIATIALQQGQRPEKVKQEMARDQSTLANLYVQMREQKALDKLLEQAEIEEVDPASMAPSRPEAPAGEEKQGEGEESSQ